MRSTVHGDLFGANTDHPVLHEVPVEAVQTATHVFGDVFAQGSEFSFQAEHFVSHVDWFQQRHVDVLPQTKAHSREGGDHPHTAEIELVSRL